MQRAAATPSYRSLLLGGLVPLLFAFAAPSGAATVQECPPGRPPKRLAVGLALERLLPSDVELFVPSAFGYGLVTEVLLGPVGLTAQGLAASEEGFSAYSGSLAVKLPLRTPFIDPFLLGGAHYWSYALRGVRRSTAGPLAGVGIAIRASGDFQIELALKGYLGGRSIVSLAVGALVRFGPQ